MTLDSRLRFIVALRAEDGKPLQWWTGEASIAGDPEGTASYTMAMDWPSHEAASRAAETARVPAGYRVLPMQETRRVHRVPASGRAA